MNNLLNSIDLVDDDVNIHSTASTVGTGSGMVDVAFVVSSSGSVPFPGMVLVICLFVYYFKRQLLFCHIFFEGYFFGTVDLSVIVTKMRKYVQSNGFFVCHGEVLLW